MAMFQQHITFSSFLGAGYGGVLLLWGVPWPMAAVAALICGIAGMLPDLDSDNSRPIREVFSFLAAFMACVVVIKLRMRGVPQEGRILAALTVYTFGRFVLPWILSQITVHRGMFHSIPAAGIAAAGAYLVTDSDQPRAAEMMALAAFLGFISHLVLDEIYSVDLHGRQIRLKKSAGSAFKMVSSSVSATFACWLMLGSLTALVIIDRGLVPTPDLTALATPITSRR